MIWPADRGPSVISPGSERLQRQTARLDATVFGIDYRAFFFSPGAKIIVYIHLRNAGAHNADQSHLIRYRRNVGGQ